MSTLREAWIDIPLPYNQSNATKVVWPMSSSEPPLQWPLIIYFHGGGLSVCSPDLVLAPARGFATLLSCVVACPTINQPPTQPFPDPIRAAWEACAWMSEMQNLNEGVLKNTGVSVDPGRGLVVGGLSSGGSAAAVIGSIPDAISAGLEDFAGLTPLRNPITGIFSGLPFLVTDAMLPLRYSDLFKSRDMALARRYSMQSVAIWRHGLMCTPLGSRQSTWSSPTSGLFKDIHPKSLSMLESLINSGMMQLSMVNGPLSWQGCKSELLFSRVRVIRLGYLLPGQPATAAGSRT